MNRPDKFTRSKPECCSDCGEEERDTNSHSPDVPGSFDLDGVGYFIWRVKKFCCEERADDEDCAKEVGVYEERCVARRMIEKDLWVVY